MSRVTSTLLPSASVAVQVDAVPDVGRRLARVGSHERAARHAAERLDERMRVRVVVEDDLPRQACRWQRAVLCVRGAAGESDRVAGAEGRAVRRRRDDRHRRVPVDVAVVSATSSIQTLPALWRQVEVEERLGVGRRSGVNVTLYVCQVVVIENGLARSTADRARSSSGTRRGWSGWPRRGPRRSACASLPAVSGTFGLQRAGRTSRGQAVRDVDACTRPRPTRSRSCRASSVALAGLRTVERHGARVAEADVCSKPGFGSALPGSGGGGGGVTLAVGDAVDLSWPRPTGSTARRPARHRGRPGSGRWSRSRSPGRSPGRSA